MKHFRILMSSSSGEFSLDIFADSAEEARSLVSCDEYQAVFINATLVA